RSQTGPVSVKSATGAYRSTRAGRIGRRRGDHQRGYRDHREKKPICLGVRCAQWLISDWPRAVSRHRARASKSVKYHERMDQSATAEALTATDLRDRLHIPDRFKWDLTHIFSDWTVWQAAYDELESKIGQFAALQGTLTGPDQLLAA